MGKLTLEDGQIDVFVKLAEGNPGALNALMSVDKEYTSIDPDAALGALGLFFQLDELGIYGSNIYILWNDVCNRNTRLFIMLMRAVQLGFFSHVKITKLAADQSRSELITSEKFVELDTKVCNQLPNFKKSEI